MNNQQARYIALLIDTEGTICPFKRETGYQHPHLSVGMVSVLPLLMGKVWGGRVDKIESQRTGKRMYRWTVAEDQLTEKLLNKIEPFLIVKKEQANLAIEMLSIISKKESNWKEETNRLGNRISELNNSKVPPEFDTIQIDSITLECLLDSMSSADIDKEDFAIFWSI